MLKCAVGLHRGNVGDIIEEKDARGVKEMLLRDLDLEQVPNPLHLALSEGAGAMKLPCLQWQGVYPSEGL